MNLEFSNDSLCGHRPRNTILLGILDGCNRSIRTFFLTSLLGSSWSNLLILHTDPDRRLAWSFWSLTYTSFLSIFFFQFYINLAKGVFAFTSARFVNRWFASAKIKTSFLKLRKEFFPILCHFINKHITYNIFNNYMSFNLNILYTENYVFLRTETFSTLLWVTLLSCIGWTLTWKNQPDFLQENTTFSYISDTVWHNNEIKIFWI